MIGHALRFASATLARRGLALRFTNPYGVAPQLSQASTNMGGSPPVLVTGGAGFIGSHLCERLLEAGQVVVAVDNYKTGRQENIHHLRAHPNFQVLERDVTVPLQAEVGQIYNLACPASPVHYQRDPIGTLQASVLGALAVLRLAERRGATVLQASTSEVYGEPAQHPQTEEYWGNTNPIGPRACYNEGKRCAETLFFDFHRHRGVPIKVARIFNTYGPRMALDDGRVISNFIVHALRGEPITVHGDGEQTRSFCYVQDLIEGLCRLMSSPEDVTGPINLGNTQEVGILQLAETVVGLTGSRSVIRHAKQLQDDPSRRQPDIAKARRTLDWSPGTTLKAGLERTIAYFDEALRRAGQAERS